MEHQPLTATISRTFEITGKDLFGNSSNGTNVAMTLGIISKKVWWSIIVWSKQVYIVYMGSEEQAVAFW